MPLQAGRRLTVTAPDASLFGDRGSCVFGRPIGKPVVQFPCIQRRAGVWVVAALAFFSWASVECMALVSRRTKRRGTKKGDMGGEGPLTRL